MYDVVISYQNEMAGKAEKIYDYLQAEGLKIFFAPVCQQDIVSEKLHIKLYNIYKNQSYLKLLLISPKYFISEWTLLEKRMALESCKNDNKRLVIVNYTGKELPDELSSFAYIDGEKNTEDQVAAFISDRIRIQLKKSGKVQYVPKTEANWEEQALSLQINSSINNGGISIGNNTTVGDINCVK